MKHFRLMLILSLLMLRGIVYAQTNASYKQCPDGNHPHMIDLGLPTGTLWACCNVGATKPEEYGGYFAWGETEEKTTYNKDTYKYYKNGEYKCYVKGEWLDADIARDIAEVREQQYKDVIVDQVFTLDHDYDVAYQKWGGEWAMPEIQHFAELLYHCKLKWTTRNGIQGCMVIGPNDSCVFLLLGGKRIDSDVKNLGQEGAYWSSFCNDYDEAGQFKLEIFDNRLISDFKKDDREEGVSVRPVVKKKNYIDVCPEKFQSH